MVKCAIYRYTICAVQCVVVLIASFVLHLIALLPPLQRKIFRNVAEQSGTLELHTKYQMCDSMKSAGGWQFIKTLVKRSFNEAKVGVVRIGGPCFNARLLQLDGATECFLKDFVKPARPLVVNFGSSS